jgi:Concanavalin A-like lectin/glucanases superfamily
MAYKRYIIKNGKKYGPYVYHSKKIDGKVVSEYQGKGSVKNKSGNFSNKKLLLGVVGLVLVLGVLLLGFSLTGNVSLDIQDVYQVGENIEGILELSLEKQEFIPAATKVLVSVGDSDYSYSLSDLIDEDSSQGIFNIKGTEISGEGLGYGVSEDYPEVDFVLNIYSEDDDGTNAGGSGSSDEVNDSEITESDDEEVIGEVSEDVSEASEVVEEEVVEEEVVEEEVVEEEVVDTKEDKAEDKVDKKEDKEEAKESDSVSESAESSEASSESSSESSDSGSSEESAPSASITGEIIKGFFFGLFRSLTGNVVEGTEVSGSVTYDKPFTYNVEEGQEVEVVSSSEKVKIEVESNVVTVTTNHKNENAKDLVINLTELDLVSEEGELSVALVYDGVELISDSVEISVLGEESNESVVEVISNESIINEIILNETIINETIVGNVSITTLQFDAVIGKPVKWKKNVKMESPEEIRIEIHKEAENVTVYKLNEVVVDEKETKKKEKVKEKEVTEVMEEITEEGVEDVEESVEEVEDVKEVKEKKEKKEKITAEVISGKMSANLNLEDVGFLARTWNKIVSTITGMVIEVQETEEIKEVVIDENATEFDIEYETPAPMAFETDLTNGKQIVISSETHYENILAYTELENEVSASEIKLYHLVNGTRNLTQFEAHDLNNNSLTDIIYWVVPHLSNQTYELIIEISGAEHLDSNRTFISDIYSEVRALDGNWSEMIEEGEYVRVTFEVPLDNTKDITIYPRGTGSVEVYEVGQDVLIAKFDSIVGNEYNKVYLTELNGTQDVFDLKVVNGSLEFDHIIDPVVASVILNSSDGSNGVGANLTVWTDQDGNTSQTLVYNWKTDGRSRAVLNMPFGSTNSAGTGKTKDYSDESKNGTVVGAVWSATGGYDGNGAYVFNGGDSIRTGTRPSLDGSSTFTTSLWANCDVNEGRGALSIRTGTSATTLFLFYPCDAAGGALGARVYYSGASVVDENSGIDRTGEWHHYSFVSRSATDHEIFVDGVSVGTGSLSKSLPSSISDVDIGHWRPSTQEFLGTIDDVMIWNYSLSDEQISALFNNGTDLMVAQETTAGESWQVCVTPNDGTSDGGVVCSNTLDVLSNGLPTHTKPILTSTLGTNLTTENLTVYNQSTTDVDGDSVKNIIDWKKGGTSIAFLNMPFEGGVWDKNALAKDYTDNSLNGTVNNAIWNATAGYDGFGAYEFDGAGDYIAMSTASSSGLGSKVGNGPFTISSWVKSTDASVRTIISGDWNAAGVDQSHRLEIDGGEVIFGINAGSNYDCIAPNILSDTWYHLVGVWNGSFIEIYVDGNLTDSTGPIEGDIPNGEQWSIGRAGNYDGLYFNGVIDDVSVFAYALSLEQIVALYNNKTDVVVSQETSLRDIWTACIIPVDGTNEGVELCSEGLAVGNVIAPTHTKPILNSTLGTNTSSENLTVYNQSTFDFNGESVKNIIDWKLNGASITRLNMPFDHTNSAGAGKTKDYADDSNNGTVTGATWGSALGYDGKGAYSFDGGNDLITIADDDSLSFGDSSNDKPFSISAWINMDDATLFPIVSKQASVTNVEYGLETMGNDAPRFQVFDSIDDVRVQVYSNEVVLTAYQGKWTHIVGVYDGSGTTDGINLYLNAELLTSVIKSVEGSYTAMHNTNGALLIGKRFAHTTQYAGGDIDEVKIFNYSLSAEQISALYNNKTDVIVSQELTLGESWTACITPNDGTEDGIELCSDGLTILSSAPTHTTPILNSTDVTLNNTVQNLTLYNQSTADIDGDSVKNIIDWRKSGTSIAVLNLPFEGGDWDEDVFAKDYSTSSNNATAGGSTTWNATGGYGGSGAYEFEGVNGYALVLEPTEFDFGVNDFSIAYNVKWNNEDDYEFISNFIEGTLYTSSKFGVAVAGTGNAIGADVGEIYLYDGDSATLTGQVISDNTWTHVAFVREGTGVNELKMYLDGVLVTSLTWGVNIVVDRLYLSYMATAAPHYFNGSIDDVLVFNYSLSPEQISALSNNRTDLIVSQETAIGDNWTGCITPNDGANDGTELCSNNLEIPSYKPTHTTPLLNSTFGTNLTTENLTVYNQTTADVDGGTIKNIIDWKKDGTSFALYNLPFEAGSSSTFTKDYTNNSFNGTGVGVVTWNATGGYDGFGAYEFDGNDGYISFPMSVPGEDLSFVMWGKYHNSSTDQALTLVSYGDVNDNVDVRFNNHSKTIFFSDDINNANSGLTSSVLAQDTWYHIGVVIEGVNKKLYVNGQLNASGTASGNKLTDGKFTTFYVGARTWDADYNLNGSIDDLMIFNFSLSAEQISALYNNRTDLIVSQETSAGDNWVGCITPVDGTEEGAELCSDGLALNFIPTAIDVILNSTLGTNFTTENLTGYWTFDDGDAGESETMNETRWYNNSVEIGAFKNLTTVHSENLTIDDNWTFGVRVNDGKEWGAWVNSSGLVILNSVPTHIQPILNSTFGTNLTTENLTVFNQSTADLEGHSVKNIIDWRVDGVSMAVINVPMDIEHSAGAGYVKDYSSFGNKMNVWVDYNTTGGYDGKGACEFLAEGPAKYNRIANSDSLKFYNNTGITISTWIKPASLSQPSSAPEIFSKMGDGRLIHLRVSGLDEIEFQLTGSDSHMEVNSANGVIAENVWAYVTAVYDPSGSSQVYINGLASGSSVSGVVGDLNCSAEIWIGRGFNNYKFNGTIDELMVFNRSLSAENVWALYSNQSDVLVSQETSSGENWTACVTPLDGYGLGTELCSDGLIIADSAPTHTKPILNSTFGTNLTTENLTVFNQTTADLDGDSIKNIIDWKKDAVSIAVLNLPFDHDNSAGAGKTKDYSDSSKNGTEVGTIAWRATGGHDGTGAYYFDGVNDMINFGDVLDGTFAGTSAKFTISVWFNTSDTSYNSIVGKQFYNDVPADNAFNLYVIGGVLRAYIKDNGQVHYIYRDTNEDITVNEWHHGVMVVDVTASGEDKLKLYYDGVEQTDVVIESGVESIDQLKDTNEKLAIGARAGDAAHSVGTYYKGMIDEVLIYDRALSAEQISALYNGEEEKIVSQETSSGENWTACITPNDGADDGTELCSSGLVILNTAPTHTTPILNSSDGTNQTTSDLTLYNQTTADTDGDSIKNIIDWKKEGSSIALLNMPFSGGSWDESSLTKDYSSSSNNGTVTDAVWNSTGGYDGFGAYEFDGDADFINLGYENFDNSEVGSMTAWVKRVDDLNMNIFMHVDMLQSDRYMTLGLISGGNLTFSVRYDALFDDVVSIGDLVSKDAWYHVAVTADGNEFLFYINGVKQTTNVRYSGANSGKWFSDLGAAQHASGYEEFIGKFDRVNGPGNYFNGTIDEFQIYNVSLSAEQVSALYNNRTDLMVSQETSDGENWTACITPVDGANEGVELCSNNLEILPNAVPTHTTPILNSTFGTNLTTENLTVFNQTTADEEGDSVKNIIDWRKSGTSIAVLNAPFEGGAWDEDALMKDYSSSSNNGTVINAVWNATAGYDGKGAYYFDGAGDYIDFYNGASISSVRDSLSISIWVKPSVLDANPRTIIMKRNIGLATGLSEYALTAKNTLVGFTIWNGLMSPVPLILNSSSTALNLNSWNHVMVVTNGVGNNASMYINGVLRGQANQTAEMGITTNSVQLGAMSGSVSDRYWNGYMDDLQVYNISLSEEQVVALYNNGTDLMVSQETSSGDNWTACITPNDGVEDGAELCSDGLVILNSIPTHTKPILNSTFGTNFTTENLTIYNQTTADIDGDSIKNVIDWEKDGTSIALLNMPFEGGAWDEDSMTKDYSSSSNNGTVTNAVWNSVGGYDGFGAYEFDGAGDYISIPQITFADDTEWSLGYWFYHDHASTNSMPLGDDDDDNNRFYHRDTGANYKIRFHNNAGDTIDFDFGEEGRLAWHHVFVTADGGNSNNIKFYYDGNYIETETLANSNFLIDSIGKAYSSSDVVDWLGRIDDVVFYNSVLSAEQVSALYNDGTDVIVSQETSLGDNWTGCITPTDGIEEGIELCSDGLEIINNAPTHTKPILNSTFGTNLTNENLTIYNQTTADIDGDSVKNIIDWRKSGSSIAILNLPFDSDDSAGAGKTKDYSTLSNNGTITDAVWSATGGYDGRGAYGFGGAGYINLDGMVADLQSSTTGTIAFWQKIDDNTANANAWFSASDGGDADSYLLLKVYGTTVSGRMYFVVYEAGVVLRVYTNTGVITNNDWIHVAVTVDENGNKMYINGVQHTDLTYFDGSSSTQAWFNTVTNIDNVRVGGLRVGGVEGTTFEGDIDEVQIYDRALSAEQISALYNNKTDLIVSQEILSGENWTACVTPNDGYVDGVELCSDGLVILNSVPTHTTPILNSTFGTNLTTENLTVFNQTTADVDGNSIKNIIDWRKSGTSIAVLNMPFDSNNSAGTGKTKDYSSSSNNGTVNNAVWNATAGYDGLGAYEFNGVSGHINLGDPAFVFGDGTNDNAFCLGAWAYRSDVPLSADGLIAKRTAAGNEFQFNVPLADSNDLQFSLFDRDGVTNFLAKRTDSNVVTLNSWHHYVACYDGSEVANGITIYVDGVNQTLTDVSANPGNYVAMSNTAVPITIGLAYVSEWAGTIDDVFIINGTLSAEQISALYNNRTDLIVSQETLSGENWTACVTPNDGVEDGGELCSDGLVILNSVPTHTQPILNSTFGTNLTTENLTVFNQTTADVDGDSIKNIIDWRKSGTSIAILNLPLDNADFVRDYSTYSKLIIRSGDPVFNATGGHDGNGAYILDGAGDFIQTATNTWNNESITLSLWFNNVDVTQESRPYARGDGSGNNPSIQIYESGIRGIVGLEGDGGCGTQIVGTSTTIQSNTMYHVVMVFNNTDLLMYLNGTLVSSDPAKTCIGFSTEIQATIGARTGSQSYFNGTVDDFMVFNYSLSAEQISALYKDGTDLIVAQETSSGENWTVCVTPLDGYGLGTELCSDGLAILNSNPTDPTSVNLVSLSPTTNASNVNLNCSGVIADDDGDAMNISVNWYNNSVLDFSVDYNNSYASGVTFSAELDSANLTVGDTWNCSIKTHDGTGESNWVASENLTIIDFTNPDISIVYPSNNTNTTNTGLNVNYTVSDINLDSCWYSNDTYSVNTTLTDCANLTSVTWVEGNHNVTIWVNDSGGNENSSSVSFTIDTTAPTLTIAVPANSTYTSVQTELNYSFVEDGTAVNTCWYSTDSGAINTTITCGDNVTGLSSGQGSSIWFIWANDSVGNEGSANVTFFVDSVLPVMTFSYPLNVSYSENVSAINYTYTETNAGYCWYSTDAGATNSSVVTMGTNFSLITGSESSNTWIIYCNDTLGNENSTSLTFFKDSVAPVVNLISPADGHSDASTITNFIFNVSDNAVTNCSLYVDGDLYAFNSSVNVSGGENKFQNTTAVGVHTWQINCTDAFNNVGNSSERSLTVTSVPPVVIPSAGGGGGGGGAVEVTVDNPFEVETSYEKTISLNRIEEDKISMKNVGETTRIFSVAVLSIGDIIQIDEEEFNLGPEESKDISFRLTPPKETGIYAGKIIISTGSYREVILVTINVKTEKSLFDVIMSVINEDKRMRDGENMSVQIDLLQMGIREKMDVTLEYVLKDFDGKTYFTESETIAVDTQKTLMKDFIFSHIPNGDYVLGVQLIYPDGVAVASSQVKIGDDLEVDESNMMIISLISALAVLAGGISFMTVRHKRMIKKLKSKKI